MTRKPLPLVISWDLLAAVRRSQEITLTRPRESSRAIERVDAEFLVTLRRRHKKLYTYFQRVKSRWVAVCRLFLHSTKYNCRATLDYYIGTKMPMNTRARPERSPPPVRLQLVNRATCLKTCPVADVPVTVNSRTVKHGAPEDTWLGMFVWMLVVLCGFYFSYNICRLLPDRVALAPPRPSLYPDSWNMIGFFMLS